MTSAATGRGASGGGHDVALSAEYFGGKTNNYVSAKEAAALESQASSAYGQMATTSHGHNIGRPDRTGPDLAPFPHASPLQTGGRGDVPTQMDALLRQASRIAYPLSAQKRAMHPRRRASSKVGGG